MRDEEELLQRLRLGDKKAFTEIYDRYWEKLLAIGYYFSKDKQAAEDVVHDVLISLWERRNDVKIESLPSYLGTAVKFCVFKMIAKRKRQREIEEGLVSPVATSETEEKLDARFFEEFSRAIIENLPEKTNLVFKFSREEELPVKEIAERTKLSGKAVEYHLTKALKSLRDSFHKIKSLFV